jgi:hypothetical protein
LYSKTKEQHWEHLWALFSILATNGLALNLEKCLFTVAELNFLGHCTSTAGVAPFRDNGQVILDLPTPNGSRALQRFLPKYGQLLPPFPPGSGQDPPAARLPH